MKHFNLLDIIQIELGYYQLIAYFQDHKNKNKADKNRIGNVEVFHRHQECQ